MMARVRVALMRQQANGTLRSEQGPGLMLLWEMGAADAKPLGAQGHHGMRTKNELRVDFAQKNTKSAINS
jgi:hypothetical protein